MYASLLLRSPEWNLFLGYVLGWLEVDETRAESILVPKADWADWVMSIVVVLLELVAQPLLILLPLLLTGLSMGLAKPFSSNGG